MDRAVIELARWFSWRRQRLDRSSRGVEDCLRSVIGVYSSNPQGPLSLLARVPRLLKGAAVEGVIGTKRAVRIPAMRRSVYMVPTDNADAVFAATRAPEAYAWLLKRSGVSPDEYERLKRDILLAAGMPKTLEQIRDAVPDPPETLGAVLQAMCADGDLLRINSSSIRSNALTYAATRVWLGRDFRRLEPDEALTWLAGDYLTAFGPATVDDFAWWAGVPVPRARAALEAHDPVDVGGGAYLHRRDERAFAGSRPNLGRLNLLPKWDCYTMGYAPAGRARFVPPALEPAVYDAGGNAGPVVLVEGEVRGTWAIRFAGDRARVTVSMLERLTPRLEAALQAEIDLVAGFLEASSVTVERVKLERPRRARATPAADPRDAPPPDGRAPTRTPARRSAPSSARSRPSVSRRPRRGGTG